MNRRQFIGTVSAGLLAAPVASSATPRVFPARILGRTGIKVSILGFGSGSRFLMYQDESKALEALGRALDAGITYIDTAHAYGEGRSEERVGRLMTARRKEVTLATKIQARTADQGRRQIELSLKRLQTDHLDVLHIHDLKSLDDLARIEAKGGVLEALYEAREQKMTRAIGITSHAHPLALRTALERHDFDCVQMALNAGLASMADEATGMKVAPAGQGSFERQVLPVARNKKLGIIAMKVFGQEQLLGTASVEDLLRYVLSLPVSLASLGMPRLEHIETNIALARSFKPMSARQRRKLSESIDPGRKLALMQHLGAHHDA